MRILMLLDHTFPPDVRVENEIETLAKAGHEVHIACFADSGQLLLEKKRYCTIHRRHISKFRFRTSVGALKFPFYFNFWKHFTKELFSHYPFHAVHVHDLPLAKVGLELKKRYKIKFILDLHENWPVLLQLSQHTNTLIGKLLSTNDQWVNYEKEMCRKADEIIVVVDEAKKRITALDIDTDKIHVVSNTLNISQFDIIDRKSFQKGKLNLLYVGGVNYHRGLQYVIEALSLLREQHLNIKFDLVGNGRYLSELKKLANDLGVNEFIVFHGFKKFTEIPELYKNADLALIPHIKSGHTDNTIPHKIFQYLYAGIPIITSNCDPLVRIVNETSSGLSYHYDNPKELANIILSFYKHPEQLLNYTMLGRKAVEDKYNWDVDGSNLSDIYNNIVK